MFPFNIPVNMPLLVYGTIAVIVFLVIYYYATGGRHGKKKKVSVTKGRLKTGEKGDLLVEIIDKSTLKVKRLWAKLLSESTYLVDDPDGEIKYLELMPDTYVFTDDNGEKIVYAIAKGNIAVPVDPELYFALSMLQHSSDRELAYLASKDYYKLVAKLARMEEEKKIDVLVPGVGKVAFTFHPPDIAEKALYHSLYHPVAALSHIVTSSSKLKDMASFAKAKAELEEAKARKYSALGGAIATILIALGIVALFIFLLR